MHKQMRDFERYLESELRRMLAAVVAVPPPVRHGVKMRGPFPAVDPPPLQLSPNAAPALEPVAVHTQASPLGEV